MPEVSKNIETGFTDRVIALLKKIIPSRFIPRWLFGLYHFLLAFFGHLIYRFPSRKLVVFGVTGTKGKTTTSYFLAQLLERAGFRVALSSTVYFQIGEKRWKNETKMGLPGRFFLPRFLSEAVRSGCQIAVIETGSEAILQNRHRFVDYDFAIFTNLAPEHIERHGGFENYKKAKLKLFQQISKRKVKKYFSVLSSSRTLIRDPEINKNRKRSFGFLFSFLDSCFRRNDGGWVIVPTIIVNLASTHAKNFLNAAGEAKKIGVVIDFETPKDVAGLCDSVFRFSSDANTVKYQNREYPFSLPGNFNIENAALAASATEALTGDLPRVLEQLHTLKLPEGRVEIIERGGVSAVIDYAHEPYSVDHILSWARTSFPGKYLIHVFGSQGGGRDVWKRAAMGSVSARYSDEIVLTNEDPYSDDPSEIVEDIAVGIENKVPVKIIIDRRLAIRYAIEKCRTRNGVLIITGKGSETVMCVGDKMIPWSDKGVIIEELGEKK